jgi:hypothetical protein
LMGSGAPVFLRLIFSVSVRPFTPAAAMRSASSPDQATRVHASTGDTCSRQGTAHAIAGSMTEEAQ